MFREALLGREKAPNRTTDGVHLEKKNSKRALSEMAVAVITGECVMRRTVANGGIRAGSRVGSAHG